MFRSYRIFHTTPIKGEKYIWKAQATNPFNKIEHVVTVEEVKDDWIDVLNFWDRHEYHSLNSFFYMYKRYKE